MASAWATLPKHIQRAIHERSLAGGARVDLRNRLSRTDDGGVLLRVPAASRGDGRAEVREARPVALIPAKEFDHEPRVSDFDALSARRVDETMQGLRSSYEEGDGELGGGSPGGAGEGAPGSRGPGSNGSGGSTLPPRVDHSLSQSDVRDQRDRNTCVAHASLACLEARDARVPRDLSRQLAHYHFNETLRRPHNLDQGILTTDAAPILSRSRVCEESAWPYIRLQADINQAVANGGYGPPGAALSGMRYGIDGYRIVRDEGLEGPSIRNVAYLEALLHAGYDVVIGTWWSYVPVDGIQRLYLDPDTREPLLEGGHAMLVVGYDRPGRYLIVKNSWGTVWEQGGYGLFDYDAIAVLFKYGFVVQAVAGL